MDDQRRSPAGPPAHRPQSPPPVAPFHDPVPPQPPSRPAAWKRLTRTVRGAAGLGIGAAALLLWPFSDWSAIPWLAGVAVLVLLALLRLDRLLRGWVWHLAGLVVVGGLMLSTSPWAWAVAASIGVLVAGLLQLPAWRLAAVGAALCLVSGVAFAFVNVQDAREAAAAQAQTNALDKGRQGFATPIEVLPALLNRLAYGDRPEAAAAVCDNLLSAPAAASFTASLEAPDCPSAVKALASRVSEPNDYADAEAPSRVQGDGLAVDACALTWEAVAAGPQLGRLTVGREGTGQTYIVTSFAACGAS
ncbi:hypothetical protein [Pseudonocardia sp.]|uniref:hypothetical protein n=1 Tax=Pseudonocardia sp. TaxID=60912 RepID=UPI00261B725F|nr:hypothetical protein [Pseudonocardia sp.]